MHQCMIEEIKQRCDRLPGIVLDFGVCLEIVQLATCRQFIRDLVVVLNLLVLPHQENLDVLKPAYQLIWLIFA